MWYFIKQSFMSFIYLIFTAVVALVIMTVQNFWLRLALSLLNLGLYLVIVCATSYKEGELALRVRISNDLERKIIVRTGEDRPLKLKEEFKEWKGFMFGLVACVPLVIMLIIHAIIVNFIDPTYLNVGAISAFIYADFYSFASLFFGELASWHYYFSLIALPILSLSTGIPYILGGRKMERQRNIIKEKKRQIYGDEN